MNESKYSQVDGQIYTLGTSRSELVSALDYWKRRVDDFTSPEGITLTGTA